MLAWTLVGTADGATLYHADNLACPLDTKNQYITAWLYAQKAICLAGACWIYFWQTACDDCQPLLLDLFWQTACDDCQPLLLDLLLTGLVVTARPLANVTTDMGLLTFASGPDSGQDICATPIQGGPHIYATDVPSQSLN